MISYLKHAIPKKIEDTEKVQETVREILQRVKEEGEEGVRYYVAITVYDTADNNTVRPDTDSGGVADGALYPVGELCHRPEHSHLDTKPLV